MTRELSAWFPTGSTLYAVLFNASAQPWDGATFDTTPTAGEWANYAITMAEDSTIGNYVGTFPGSASAGAYSYRVYKRAGGIPATTDPVVWTGEGQWAGTAWAYQSGDSFARIGAAGAGLTAVGDTAGTTTLLSRLSATRAGYLDNLSAGAVALQSTLTSVATDVTTILGRVTAAVATAASLATLQTDVTTLLGRLTALRAGYLDNLSAGAVALEASVQTAITNIAGVASASATAVWAAGTRTLTGFGTLVADIWTASTAPTAAAVAAAVWTVGNLTVAAVDRIADVVLRRTLANVVASSFGDAVSQRSPIGAFRKLVNRVSMTTLPGSLQVFKKEGDVVVAYSQAVDVDATADPVTEVG